MQNTILHQKIKQRLALLEKTCKSMLIEVLLVSGSVSFFRKTHLEIYLLKNSFLEFIASHFFIESVRYLIS